MARDSQSAAQGYAWMGQLGMASSFRSDLQYGFTLAAATAGWNELIVFAPQNRAQNGQSATLSFLLQVSGVRGAEPTGNSATQLAVAAYRHHQDASLPYYRLGMDAASPRLPAGYILMMLICLVPPLWRRAMLPSLVAWQVDPRTQVSAGRRLTCFGLYRLPANQGAP